ncbi:MAG: precorrin-8X methylmutase [Proteobacteria bacterium]|nr:precorrin-8X methylmutase [Pseudomonadota bacterium]
MDYIRDPDEIYRRSFALVAKEADVSEISADAIPLAHRLVHACGMPDITQELDISPTAIANGRQALTAGKPIFADCTMVASGIIRKRLQAGNDIICTLNDAVTNGVTTRSAAAVELWRSHLDGAVVAIGNAPTALFRLLELLADGAPKPAVILGFPVGFVGAAESKAALAKANHGVPYITLRGRRGGSAMAAAAVNALASDAIT